MHSPARRLLVPAAVAGLLFGGVRASQAQVNFIDTNSGITYLSTASGSPTVTQNTNSVNVEFGPGESYVINSPGGSNAVTHTGAGAGTVISLSPANNGLREISTGGMNQAQINYRFDITLQDVNSGSSSIVQLPFTFNSMFGAGNNSGDGVTAFTLPGPTQIGNDIFTFSEFTFTPGGAPVAGGGGSVPAGMFSLRVQGAPAAVPEPGTVAMLVGIGISGSAFALRRRATK